MPKTSLAPARTDNRTTVRFDPEIVTILAAEAKRRRVTYAALVRQLTQERLDQLGLLG